MPTIQTPEITTLVKLASLVVHVQEALSPKGHGLDTAAIRALADDPSVAAWLVTIPSVLLPVKR
jgi:hypothetical protein